MQRIAKRDGPAVLAIDFAACNVYAGGIDAARELRCPVLFILGSLDVMTAPKAAKPLVDACAAATVVLIDGGGHSLMAERPDEVLEALKAFAARVLAQLAEPAR
jgi:pimeloyl-ACP methyl ester carboxylesterase